MRILPAVLVAALPALAAADPFAGTWEVRVATEQNPYTMRLHCVSSTECETQVIPANAKEAKDAPISFKSARAQPNVKPLRDALAYAHENRAQSAVNPEFAALHKLLAGTTNPKTQVDACISLDPQAPEFFVVCTVKGSTSMRPMVLFFGSLLGLCGQGFCKYVVYPMVKTR